MQLHRIRVALVALSMLAVAACGSSGPLDDLRDYLSEPAAERPPIQDQPFATVALSREDAETAADLLWEDLRARIEPERQAELTAKTVTAAGKTMKYDFRTFGDAPAGGHSLYISLHGGGQAPPEVNEQQWQNQITLYQPAEGIYLAPRAPTDEWNLWHQDHIDPLFDRLIANHVAFAGVDPNKVYVMGYSAGGDGVYQLAPRMADRWAAAAMMAGHPNDASPLPLRNIGFTGHVGALDDAYMRNAKLTEWKATLDQLQQTDADGYVHELQLHDGKGHWMDLEDAVAVPWMAMFTRKPLPEKVVWVNDDVAHARFYWLAVEEEWAVSGMQFWVSRSGSNFEVENATHHRLAIRLTDEMTDLDQPITVTRAGATLASVQPERTIATIAKTLAEREQRSGIFTAEVWVDIP